jgi:hypothetical protein
MQWVEIAAHPFIHPSIHSSHRQILPEPASPPHGPLPMGKPRQETA